MLKKFSSLEFVKTMTYGAACDEWLINMATFPFQCFTLPNFQAASMMTHSPVKNQMEHYSDIIMGAIASQITSLTIIYSTVYSNADQRKHQSSMSLAFVWEIHRGPVNSPHKWPVTRKMFPFDDIIMLLWTMGCLEPTTVNYLDLWIPLTKG